MHKKPFDKSKAIWRERMSRRTLLRGAGVAMALPWLESVNVWGSTSASVPPKRFAAMFMGCGINSNHWWAKGQGAGMELGRSLEPLNPLRDRLNVINGLFNRSAVGVGIHPGQTGNILSGAQLQKGAVLNGGMSMDQALANHFATETLQPSIVLGCEEPTTGYHETNFSLAYSSHISWQSATSPVPLEIYPSLAFDSLFNNRGNLRNLSVLDRVLDQAKSLSRSVSSTDKSKIDEYLTSVREIEKEVERMRDTKSKADERAGGNGLAPLTMKRPENGLPEDLREHMKLMCDIIALGFQTDKTRVASLVLCRDLSGLYYPFLGVRSAHHGASHSDQSEDYHKICHFYVSQLAYLAGRLSEMREGEGTVLDNSCLVFLSNMWSGSRHDSTRVPLLQVGGLSGSIQTGRVIDYAEAGDDNRKLCSLYLSIMRKMGLQQSSFGDADAVLAGF